MSSSIAYSCGENKKEVESLVRYRNDIIKNTTK